MCFDELRLCLQQQVDILSTVQLGQFALLQWILFGFQRDERKPVSFLRHGVQWRILYFTSTMLLTLRSNTKLNRQHISLI